MKVEKDEEGNIVAASGQVLELKVMNLWMKGCCASIWGNKNGIRIYKLTPMSTALVYWDWVNTKRIEA